MTPRDEWIYTPGLTGGTIDYIDGVINILTDAPGITVENGIIVPSRDCPPDAYIPCKEFCDQSYGLILTVSTLENKQINSIDDAINLLNRSKKRLVETD